MDLNLLHVICTILLTVIDGNPSSNGDIDKPHILGWLIKASTKMKDDVVRVRHPHGTCQLIGSELCKNRWYNMTMFPNLFKHANQLEADSHMKNFVQLISSNCSKELVFFLCSLHYPICLSNYDKDLPPCRPVCQRVRQQCEPLIRSYGQEWPEILDCQQFPLEDNSDNQLCMDTNATYQNENHRVLHGHHLPNSRKNDNEAFVFSPNSAYDSDDDYEFWDHFNETIKPDLVDVFSNSEKVCNCECRPPFIQVNDPMSHYFNKVRIGNQLNCLQPCYHPALYRNPNNFDQINQWLKVWTLFTLVSVVVRLVMSLFNVLRRRHEQQTFDRLKPKQLQLSHLGILMAFLIRLIAGHRSVVCVHGLPRQTSGDNVIQQLGWSTAQCFLVFVVLFYSTMSSYSWWLGECLRRLLVSLSFRETSKTLSLLKLMGWGLPMVQLLVAISMRAINSDTLGGVCFVTGVDSENPGNSNNLVALVVVPFGGYLLVGWLVFTVLCWRLQQRRQGMMMEAMTTSNLSVIYILLNGITKSSLFLLFLIEVKWSDVWLENALCADDCPRLTLMDRQNNIMSIEIFTRMKYAVWIMMPIFDFILHLDELSTFQSIEKSPFIFTNDSVQMISSSRPNIITTDNNNESNDNSQQHHFYMTSSVFTHNQNHQHNINTPGTCSTSQLSLQESVNSHSGYSSMKKLIYPTSK